MDNYTALKAEKFVLRRRSCVKVERRGSSQVEADLGHPLAMHANQSRHVPVHVSRFDVAFFASSSRHLTEAFADLHCTLTPSV